jgi:hypothetical protein
VVGKEPVAIAITPDSTTYYVVNAIGKRDTDPHCDKPVHSSTIETNERQRGSACD